MPANDRETCPACGKRPATQSTGFCAWCDNSQGEDISDLFSPEVLAAARRVAAKMNPDPALRTAGLAGPERSAELHRLIEERDEARKLADSCGQLAAIYEVSLTRQRRNRARAERERDEARRELAAVVKAFIGPNEWLGNNTANWRTMDVRGEWVGHGTRAGADAAVAEAVRRVAEKEEGGGG